MLPMPYIPRTTGQAPQIQSQRQTAQQHRNEATRRVMNAARIAFFGVVGAIVGGVVAPQVAGEYFDWRGGAAIGGVLLAAISAQF